MDGDAAEWASARATVVSGDGALSEGDGVVAEEGGLAAEGDQGGASERDGPDSPADRMISGHRWPDLAIAG